MVGCGVGAGKLGDGDGDGDAAAEMAGGRPHTIREEAGSGAMVAARSRLPSAVSVPVRDDSVRAMVGCGVGAAKLGDGEADTWADAVTLPDAVACAADAVLVAVRVGVDETE